MSKVRTKKDYYTFANSRKFKWLGPFPKTVHHKTWWECPNKHKWETTYNIIKSGCGCPVCSNRIKKTENDYNNLANGRGFKWIGKKLPIVTRYKTWWECEKEHKWQTSYESIRVGSGCPYCAGIAKKTKKDYNVLAKSRGFKWVGEKLPKSVLTKTWWECEKEHRWKTTYNNIYNGNGCPHCASNAVKVKEDYIKLANHRGFIWTGVASPKNIQTKTQWKCKNKHVWCATYHDIYKGSNCPKCKNRVNGVPVSKPQIKLNNLLCGSLNYPEGRYRIDVAIMRRSQKIAVEYDCWYWHQGKEEYDAKRDKFLISRGWKIIHIKTRNLLPTKKQVNYAIEQVLDKKKKVNVFLEDWVVENTMLLKEK